MATLVLAGGGDRFATTAQGRTPLEVTTSKAIRELFRQGIDYWQHRRHAQHSHAMKEVARTLLLVDQRLDADAERLAPHMPAALPYLPVEIWLVVLGFLRSADFMPPSPNLAPAWLTTNNPVHPAYEIMSGTESDVDDIFDIW